MPQIKNLTGRRFGKLTALEPTGRKVDGRSEWLCRCDCGNQAAFKGTNLTNGYTQSCGCLKASKWSPSEQYILSQYFKETPPVGRDISNLLRLLPGRTEAAVSLKVSRSGFTLKGYCKEEVNAIQDYYASNDLINLDELSARLGRPKSSICTVAGRLGLTNIKRNKRTVLRMEQSPKWKGDLITRRETGHARARSKYKVIGTCERCLKKPAVDRHHKDDNTKNNDRVNISFLCRRCHMEEDGRLRRLAAIERPTSPPKNCRVCGELKKPLRKSRCHRCNEFYRRKGFEWSPEAVAPLPRLKGECENCGMADLLVKHLCHNCYVYRGRTGKSRPVRL